jgi:hypothetical protein
MRQFKFLCFAASERRHAKRIWPKTRQLRPVCGIFARAATHTIRARHAADIDDTIIKRLPAFHHERFTDFVISGDAS